MARRVADITALLPFLLYLALLGCTATATAPVGPQRSAEELRLDAELHIGDNQLREAATVLQQAVAASDYALDHALRYGEVLEALERYDEAATTYRRGLQPVAAQHPLYNRTVYRLALLALFRFDDENGAREFAERLAEGTPEVFDIRGVLAISADQPRRALELFNHGLAAKPDKEVAGRILQHAAMAYTRLGLSENAHKALFNAINLSKNKPSLAQDIEADWQRLKEESAER